MSLLLESNVGFNVKGVFFSDDRFAFIVHKGRCLVLVDLYCNRQTYLTSQAFRDFISTKDLIRTITIFGNYCVVSCMESDRRILASFHVDFSSGNLELMAERQIPWYSLRICEGRVCTLFQDNNVMRTEIFNYSDITQPFLAYSINVPDGFLNAPGEFVHDGRMNCRNLIKREHYIIKFNPNSDEHKLLTTNFETGEQTIDYFFLSEYANTDQVGVDRRFLVKSQF